MIEWILEKDILIHKAKRGEKTLVEKLPKGGPCGKKEVQCSWSKDLMLGSISEMYIVSRLISIEASDLGRRSQVSLPSIPEWLTIRGNKWGNFI